MQNNRIPSLFKENKGIIREIQIDDEKSSNCMGNPQSRICEILDILVTRV